MTDLVNRILLWDPLPTREEALRTTAELVRTAVRRSIPAGGSYRLPISGGRDSRHLLLELLDDRERLISTLLLGNNIVNILAASLATDVLLRVFGDAVDAPVDLPATLLDIAGGGGRLWGCGHPGLVELTDLVPPP